MDSIQVPSKSFQSRPRWQSAGKGGGLFDQQIAKSRAASPRNTKAPSRPKAATYAQPAGLDSILKTSSFFKAKNSRAKNTLSVTWNESDDYRLIPHREDSVSETTEPLPAGLGGKEDKEEGLQAVVFFDIAKYGKLEQETSSKLQAQPDAQPINAPALPHVGLLQDGSFVEGVIAGARSRLCCHGLTSQAEAASRTAVDGLVMQMLRAASAAMKTSAKPPGAPQKAPKGIRDGLNKGHPLHGMQ